MTIAISGTTGVTLAGQFDSASTFGFKNRIINGGMGIDQRNAGASVSISSATGYAVDRFPATLNITTGSTAQQSSTAPAGFNTSLKITIGTAGTVVTGTNCRIYQGIEGFNVADLGWGSANASTITISFWVNCSVTGTFAGGLYNAAANRTYVFTYSVNAANTWEQKTITIAGDTSGTWAKDNTGGIYVNWDLGSGATYQATAGSWGAGAAWATSGSVKLATTTGATFYITGVQLEKGSVATSFDFRSYGTELALCQRYLPAITENSNSLFGFFYSTTNAYVGCTFPVTARVAPTGAIFSSAGHFTIGDVVSSAIAATSASLSSAGNSTGQLIFVASGLTAQRAGFVVANSSSAKILFTGCEL